AVARIVHEHVDGEPALSHLLGEALPAARRTEVERDRGRADAVLPRQPLGGLGERVAAPRGEDEVVPVPREALGEIEPDAARGAGDERGLTCSRLCVCHVESSPSGYMLRRRADRQTTGAVHGPASPGGAAAAARDSQTSPFDAGCGT